MASLYKKPIVRTDAKTGEKIKSHSKKWWGQFRDRSGKLRRHPLCADKAAAQAMLNELVRQAERDRGKRAGPTSEDRDRIKALERENRELRQANEILRKASAYFALSARSSSLMTAMSLASSARSDL